MIRSVVSASLVLAGLTLSGAAAPLPAHGVAHAKASGGGMCKPGETVVFACGIRAKAVAVCASGTGKGAFVQYRFGSPGKVELAYPAAPGAGALHYATTAYSGGGEVQIGFAKGGYDYVAYSRTVRTRFDGKGNDPKFSAGVMVRKGDKMLADMKCTNPADASIDVDRAEALLPQGEFIYAD